MGELPVADGPLPRFLIAPQIESVEGFDEDPLPPGAYLLTDDAAGLSTQVALLLKRLNGAHPVHLTPADLADNARLDACLAAARKQHGAIRGLIHLAPVGAERLDVSASLERWRDEASLADKSLFRLVQRCAPDLKDGGRIVAASGLGGLFGRGVSLDGLTAGGGATGFLKCVNEEWPGLTLKAVDLDPQRPADENAHHLVTELRLPGGRIEVGYRDGVRRIFRTVEALAAADDIDPHRQPDPSWVVLASGGARGITAEVIRDLASAGVTLVVTGRTPEPTAESPQTAALTTDAELKAYLIGRARDEGRDVRPVAIQRELGALLRDREMAANIADLRAAGATVDYRVCDMTDPDMTAGLFDDIYREYGRLDGVVHGAGIIEDKYLEDKTEESWYRVFDTKVDSVFLLARHLRPETLRFLVVFTSVAGRYGNSGQTDYAAGNEAVNRAAWALQRIYGPGTKVAAINWGPWEPTRHGRGMVSEEAKRKFAARGVGLVTLEGGRALFTHEVTRAPVSQVEVIAGQGPWEQVEVDYGRFREGTRIDAAAIAHNRPLLGGATIEIGADDVRVVRRTLRRSTDLYLDQHPINGVPVLPAAVGLEMLAEAATTVCPGFVITELSDLRLLSGIRFVDDEIAVRVEATVGKVRTDEDRIAVELTLYEENARGGRPSYRATAHLNGAPLECPAYQSLIKPGASEVSAREAYERILFHGPCFQLIAHIDGLDRQGAAATLRSSPPLDLWLADAPSGAGWLFDPGCVDAAAQMGVVYGHVLHGESALPNRFGRVRRFGQGPMPECRMYFLAHPEQPEHRVRADVAFVDDHGRLRLFVEQLECTSSAALNKIGGGWKGKICV